MMYEPPSVLTIVMLNQAYDERGLLYRDYIYIYMYIYSGHSCRPEVAA